MSHQEATFNWFYDVVKSSLLSTMAFQALQMLRDLYTGNSGTFFKFALKSGNKEVCRTTLRKEMLIFLASLGHSGDIRKLTDKPPTAPKEKKSGKAKQKTSDGSGADEGTGVAPGVPDAPDYDSEDDISWKSSDDDQVDEQAQDDEDADKNDVNETTQDDEDDDDHDDDEKVQDDDEHDLTTHDDDIVHEEETDSDTPSSTSASDDEDDDNEVEGTNVEGAKSDEEATYEEDQGYEAVEDTNTDLDGRDEVMTDVNITPWFSNPRKLKTLIVTLNLRLILLVTNRARLLKALKDNFSELRQTNQYAEALSSIPSTSDQYLANKCRKHVDVEVRDIQRHLYKAFSWRRYEADKILLDTYGDTVTIKRPRDGADDDQEPSAGTDRGSKRRFRRAGKEIPASPVLLKCETITKTARDLDYLVQDLRAHKKSATPICSGRGKLYANLQMSLKGPADQSLKQESMMIQAEKSTTSSWMFSTTYKTTFFLHLDGLLYDGMMMFFYKFKKGDFHRLMISIEDMLLLFVQGKCDKSQQLKHVFASMSLYECLHGRVVIQPACEDLHLGVESYQKKTQPHKADTHGPVTLCTTPPSSQSKKDNCFKTPEIHLSIDSLTSEFVVLKRWYSAPAFRSLKSSALLSLEPKSHHKISLGTLILPEHQSGFIHNEDGNPAEPTSIQAHVITWFTLIVLVLLDDVPIMRTCEYVNLIVMCLGKIHIQLENPVKKILLKLNLSDHRLFKMVVESKPTEDNGWSDLLGSSEALSRNGIEMDNSETSIRIHPFYIEKVLLERSPGVGKTSLVLALGKFSGHSVVHVDKLIEEDHLFICRSLHPSLSDCLLKNLIAFNKHLYEDTMVNHKFGQIGSPWEFNLRDIIRSCQIIEGSPREFKRLLLSEHSICSKDAFIH
ncbi:retrovirus-related pol polyprotein from transposon TNT 1-94 [Tanacetum coccineum]|uniref:Retrovirus-related pol polyprotein from transposon TNT 1-94 n=1 Tax=Tanacetum coccineum TaxID=301880 RepID=A0ABQ5CN30_9ASTR